VLLAAATVVAVVLLAAGLRRVPGGSAAWAVPALLRLAEYAMIVRVTDVLAPGALPLAFALLFALAIHHYDTLYAALGSLPGRPAERGVQRGVVGRARLRRSAPGPGPARAGRADALDAGLAVGAVLGALLFVVIGPIARLSSVSAAGG
jgi:hypothetical protein